MSFVHVDELKALTVTGDVIAGVVVFFGLLILLGGLSRLGGPRRHAKMVAEVTKPKSVSPQALPSWAPSPYPPVAWADDPPPPSQIPPPYKGGRGIVAIIAGALILAVGATGAVVMVAATKSQHTRNHTKVALPNALDGLPRIDGKVGGVRQSLVDDPGQYFVDEEDFGTYSDGKNVLIVDAARAWNPFPSHEFDDIKGADNNPTTIKQDPGSNVSPGPLGGVARCYKINDDDLKGYLCGFVDKGSLMLFYDSRAKTLAQAAEIGRELRNQVITRT